MNSEQIRELIKNLQIVMRCPKCNQIFHLENIFLKGQAGSNYQLQLNCANCKTPVYANIAIKGNLPNLPKTTHTQNKIGQDITKTKKSQNRVPISSDEIIQMHQFLTRYRGKISDLF
ncbi:MAG TPA: hypothetical protein VJJ80_02605 [Patescibacteria group bacterium]|nr:hypothetical protein [Patescibacteria group bacterium]